MQEGGSTELYVKRWDFGWKLRWSAMTTYSSFLVWKFEEVYEGQHTGDFLYIKLRDISTNFYPWKQKFVYL